MKKDFAIEKASLLKEWQQKCEETALLARQQEKDAAKVQLSKTIADYNGRIEALEKTIQELKLSVQEHRQIIQTKDQTIEQKNKVIEQKEEQV